MSPNIIAQANKTLSDYLFLIKEKPEIWQKQMDTRYPWISPQLDRLQKLLEMNQGEFCPESEKREKKRIARANLSEFVMKFQNMYMAMRSPKLPQQYQRKHQEPLVDFYQRFVEAAKQDTEILGITYITEAPMFHWIKQALKDYIDYSRASQIPRKSYDEISALTRSLRAFFILVKKLKTDQSL